MGVFVETHYINYMAHGLTRCRQSEREQKATNRYDRVVVAIDDLPRFETLINDCDLLAVLLCCVCDQPCDMGLLLFNLSVIDRFCWFLELNLLSILHFYRNILLVLISSPLDGR